MLAIDAWSSWTRLAAVNRIDALYAVLEGYYFNRGFTLGERRFSKEQGIYSPHRERHTYLLFIPRFANARRDPRFAPLLTELGLEDYWRVSGTKPDFRANS